jgi:hypothetical protein
MFGRHGDQTRGGHLEPDITERGTIGWRLVVAGIAPDKASAQAQSNRWSGSACWKAIRQNNTV